MQIFDPASNNWTTGTPLPTERYGAASGVIDGKFYVVGGYNGNDLDVLEIYDPVADTWSSGAPMPTARTASGAGVINGKLYVVGGRARTVNHLV